MLKWFLLFVFVLFITPYTPQLKGAAKTWEPRREKKRRLRREREAAERSNSNSDTENEQAKNDMKESASSDSVSLLPTVKAAEVVEEGTGYAPPKSHRFNFVADAVDVAGPAVVYIEIQGRCVFNTVIRDVI